MKNPYFFIIIALILTTLMIIYNQLGGLNEPVITYEPVEQYTFAGKRYSGVLRDQAFEDLLSEIRNIKIENDYGGALALIWSEESENEDDAVDVFIGIQVLAGDTLSFPLELVNMEMDGLVRAALKGHASVLPSASSVVSKLRDFARERQYTLQDLVIDKYLSDSVVYTEIPVKITIP